VPVPDVVHPVLERRVPALRHDVELTGPIPLHHALGERLHLHEPLVRQARLDHRVAPITAPHCVLVLLGFDEETFALELLCDALSGFEAVDADEICWYAMG